MAGKFRPNLKLRALTLAEIVGVIALGIAALTWWDGHRERQETEKQRQEEAQAKAGKSVFLVKAQAAKDGERLNLTSVHSEQVIQTQTLWFPKDVRADKVELTGDARLDADLIADGVRKVKAESGRVPVVVETTFIQDGQTKTDDAIYSLAYSLHHRLLLPDQVRLKGLALAKHEVKGQPQDAADKIWADGK
jgi:hypothetical protein